MIQFIKLIKSYDCVALRLFNVIHCCTSSSRRPPPPPPPVLGGASGLRWGVDRGGPIPTAEEPALH